MMGFPLVSYIRVSSEVFSHRLFVMTIAEKGGNVVVVVSVVHYDEKKRQVLLRTFLYTVNFFIPDFRYFKVFQRFIKVKK